MDVRDDNVLPESGLQVTDFDGLVPPANPDRRRRPTAPTVFQSPRREELLQADLAGQQAIFQQVLALVPGIDMHVYPAPVVDERRGFAQEAKNGTDSRLPIGEGAESREFVTVSAPIPHVSPAAVGPGKVGGVGDDLPIDPDAVIQLEVTKMLVQQDVFLGLGHGVRVRTVDGKVELKFEPEVELVGFGRQFLDRAHLSGGC